MLRAPPNLHSTYQSVNLPPELAKALRLPRNLHFTLQSAAPATKSVLHLHLAREQHAAPATKSAPQVAKVTGLPRDLHIRLFDLYIYMYFPIYLSIYLSIYHLTLRKCCESAASATQWKSALDLAREQHAAPATRFAPPKQSERPCHGGIFRDRGTLRDSVGLYLLILTNSIF